ncbi:MAG: toll/interleukin-1 receptor domain-containing protein [Candidatus Zixiibacteriota bacterium]|nr:MAG: toll/interleukin-1 receptor domain-containing protein [candidate division Zixibacteria bacterium]
MVKEDSNKIKLFLSYSSQGKFQQDFVKAICDSNIMKGKIEFIMDIDGKAFLPGENWKTCYNEIVNKKRTGILFFLSPEFLKSEPCKHELDKAGKFLYPRGVPLIPVKIKNCKVPPPFIDATIYVDMVKLFSIFKSRKGEIKDIQELKGKLKDLIKKIIKVVDKYENKIIVHRVINENDPLLKESQDLFEEYPKNYRDKFKDVCQWILESANRISGYYVHEHYYIAYYRATQIGILYATYYPSDEHNKGYCFIYPLIIKSGLDKDLISAASESLMKKLTGNLNKVRKDQMLYLTELPFAKNEERNIIEECIRGWENLTSCKLGWYKNIKYYSPDIRELRDEIRRNNKNGYRPDEMCLIVYNPENYYNQLTINAFDDILKFVYFVYQGEAYVNPFWHEDWFKCICKWYMESTNLLPDKIKIEKFNPGDIKKILKN